MDDEGTLARVSCGNSRVRAPGFASLHSLCVNIQFPRPAWRDAGRKELSAVEISVGGWGLPWALGPPHVDIKCHSLPTLPKETPLTFSLGLTCGLGIFIRHILLG